MNLEWIVWSCPLKFGVWFNVALDWQRKSPDLYLLLLFGTHSMRVTIFNRYINFFSFNNLYTCARTTVVYLRGVKQLPMLHYMYYSSCQYVTI